MRKTILATAAVLMSLTFVAAAQTVVVPGEVRTYVLEQTAPSVVYEGEIVVGKPLPDTVEIITIPSNNSYGYAVVNDQRVLVDPGTKTVIEVIQ